MAPAAESRAGIGELDCQEPLAPTWARARSFITAADADCSQQHGKEIKSRLERPFCSAGG